MSLVIHGSQACEDQATLAAVYLVIVTWGRTEQRKAAQNRTEENDHDCSRCRGRGALDFNPFCHCDVGVPCGAASAAVRKSRARRTIVYVLLQIAKQFTERRWNKTCCRWTERMEVELIGLDTWAWATTLIINKVVLSISQMQLHTDTCRLGRDALGSWVGVGVGRLPILQGRLPRFSTRIGRGPRPSPTCLRAEQLTPIRPAARLFCQQRNNSASGDLLCHQLGRTKSDAPRPVLPQLLPLPSSNKIMSSQ